MISVSEAEKIIFDQVKLFPSSIVSLENAYGRVLREDIKTDRDQPAFNKSTMDGIAISFGSWRSGHRRFVVEGVAPAGQKGLKLKNINGCAQIMTGAVVPSGGDCVVPIENVKLENKIAVIADSVEVRQGQNIRYRGADHKKGAVLLRQGCHLLPPRIATVASFGQSKIKVTIKPKIAVISTGDELVDISRKNIQPYHIRKSNFYALDATLRQTGLCEVQMFHFKDDKKLLLREIKKILVKFDILVLSGGVSMGEFDYVPQVLKELGVEVLFHKVAQKPGKPFWFGKGKNKKGKAVFALPGNPVSTQVCAYRYVVPYLKKAAGLPYHVQYAVLAEDFFVNTHLTYFAPVTARFSMSGMLVATPVAIGGSGDYASLSQADGFIELEAGRRQFPKGFVAPFYSW